ncbi:MAG: RNA 2',3'-cyclic phosphodiesterase [Polyangiales bacterium]
MQRLFTAIALDEATRQAIELALASTRREAAKLPTFRFLAAENWHFTLQFLGAVEDETVPAVDAACAAAASRHAAFDLELSGLGAFNSVRKARVLWIGVSRGGDEMRALYETLLVGTARLGLAPEERDYSPHLTFARLKRPANVEGLLAQVQLPALRMQVTELTLFRSHLSQRGSRYEVIGRYALGGTAG